MRRGAGSQLASDKAAGGVAVVYRRIDQLRLDPKNPRLHGAKQIRQIARSVEAFGFNCPVLVDATLKVIASHGRVLAAQERGAHYPARPLERGSGPSIYDRRQSPD